jgi:hypothetical protein
MRAKSLVEELAFELARFDPRDNDIQVAQQQVGEFVAAHDVRPLHVQAITVPTITVDDTTTLADFLGHAPEKPIVTVTEWHVDLTTALERSRAVAERLREDPQEQTAQIPADLVRIAGSVHRLQVGFTAGGVVYLWKREAAWFSLLKRWFEEKGMTLDESSATPRAGEGEGI